nr:MAG: hypothetical protein DIU67_03115 [Actinomycetota bacterium]
MTWGPFGALSRVRAVVTFPGMTRPVVVAHRGSRYLWPENTMVAFEGAVRAGATHIETDLRVTADGVVVCLHDPAVDRTTEGHGLVHSMEFARIRSLDAGYRHRGVGGFPYRGAGVKVPALEELVTSFPDVQLILEMKTGAVIPGLLRLFATYDLYDRAVVGSFGDRWLDEVRRASGGRIRTSTGLRATRRWVVAARTGRRPPRDAAVLHVPVGFRGVPVVDGRLVSLAHALEVPVFVWTVNRPDEMRTLAGLGVDGLITDRPDLALAMGSRA